MAPKPRKSIRPVGIKWNTLEVDAKKHLFIFETEFGHKITSKIINNMQVNQETEFPQPYPEYFVQYSFKPLKVEPQKNSKNMKDMRDILRRRNILDQEDVFDDVMIGFVYGDERDPNNHTWMFQFRLNGQVVGTMNYINIDVRKCPMKTFAWFENEIWHLRFFIEKKDIKSIEEVSFNNAVLTGKGIKKIISSTSEEIPKEYDRVRMRCDVKKNNWFAEFLDRKQSIIKIFTLKNIKCSAPIYGNVDFMHPKPWVSDYCLKKEIQDIQILDDLLVIQGKVK